MKMPWPELLAGSLITAVVGLLVFTVRSILKGDLVPRGQADFYKALYERELQEHERTREAMMAMAQHERAGIEAARLTAEVMQGVRPPAEST